MVLISLSLGWCKDHEGCFVFYILLFNDFMSFPAKVYEINMYLLLYLSFKIKVEEYTQLQYNAMLF